MINGELIIDNFAGGGGASTGIEMATGYSVDIAINHDPEAIRMHKTNHPNTNRLRKKDVTIIHQQPLFFLIFGIPPSKKQTLAVTAGTRIPGCG